MVLSVRGRLDEKGESASQNSAWKKSFFFLTLHGTPGATHNSAREKNHSYALLITMIIKHNPSIAFL